MDIPIPFKVRDKLLKRLSKNVPVDTILITDSPILVGVGINPSPPKACQIKRKTKQSKKKDMMVQQ